MSRITKEEEGRLFSTFFISTEGIWTCCKRPNRKADYTSKSGSKYWYGKDKNGYYVIRYSNHWSKVYSGWKNSKECGWVRSCRWYLKGAWATANCGKIYLKNLKKISK